MPRVVIYYKTKKTCLLIYYTCKVDIKYFSTGMFKIEYDFSTVYSCIILSNN